MEGMDPPGETGTHNHDWGEQKKKKFNPLLDFWVEKKYTVMKIVMRNEDMLGTMFCHLIENRV